MRIGVDTGGTFTDFVLMYDDGRLETFKLRSNPADPAAVIVAGLARAASGAELLHGSTVATNALLERKGARTAFVATAGFEDLFHIGRQNRRELYNLTPLPRLSIVDRADCFGVPERMLFDGSVLRAPSAAALRRLAAALRKSGVEAVAICLLHSCQNAAHERAVEEALAGIGFVTASSRVSPEFREYERASTTILNAYVGPIVERYLARLAAATVGRRVSILQSNGGVMRPGEAQKLAVRTLLSGPAGGAVGAAWIAAQSGYRKVLGFDMGGTSTDVCLIDGAPGETTEASIDGFPVRIPMLDIHTVGAGGGSIARVDEGGLLRVGPQSAGAEPGPACYGIGEQATVTDAHVVLGRIAAEQLAGGTLRVEPQRAHQAIAALGRHLGLSPSAAAAGVLRVANANMERAIRAVSVERGHDPREFALLAFGGGGALHACELAAAFEMDTVLVPELAGSLSALGMLVADRVRDYSQGVLGRSDFELAFAALERQSRAENPRARLLRTADLRYAGQGYELNVAWPSAAGAARNFHAAHRQNFGYADARRALEVVALRVRAVERQPKPPLQSARRVRAHELPARRVFTGGRWHQTRVFARASLGRGPLPGPALILDYGSTVLTPPGWAARLDRAGTLVLRRS